MSQISFFEPKILYIDALLAAKLKQKNPQDLINSQMSVSHNDFSVHTTARIIEFLIKYNFAQTFNHNFACCQSFIHGYVFAAWRCLINRKAKCSLSTNFSIRLFVLSCNIHHNWAST